MVLSVSFRKIQLPPNATGPDTLAFEPSGRFYTSVHDGQSLLCNGIDPATLNPACGRPLGLALHYKTNKLYVCDAYYGLGVLGAKGGQATILSTGADGQPYRLCDAVDVNQGTENVYFTDVSAVYDISQAAEAIRNNDSTGRVLKYDMKTKQVTVLFKNLSGAAGVAVDEEEKFVMASEINANKTKDLAQGFKSKEI
ncbi:hypothetical protein PTKIN_Ptkin05aG0187900 [Pterospermum kingtungense]